MSYEPPKCPYCGSTRINAPFVDIGVGEIQCGPYVCDDCLAVQINPYIDPEDLALLTNEEKRIGWHKPREDSE